MKRLVAVAVIGLAAIIGFLLWLAYDDTRDPYVEDCDYTVPAEEIPLFTEVDIAFEHFFDATRDLPMMAGAVIDIDGDGLDELFFGGGAGQADALFRYIDGGFEDISQLVGIGGKVAAPSIGAVSFDLDEDGPTDLLVTRRDGVFLLHNLGGHFESLRLPIEPDDKSSPATLTVGDYDRDGDGDIFLATYLKQELMEGQTIFNQQGYGSNSLLLRNDGALHFTDVTQEVGLQYTHNTFQGVFVDLDADGWLDLVVAYDTGEPRIYQNHRGERFSVEVNPLSGQFAYPMGIAVGDYDNDRRVDLFFSNTGSTVPRFLAKGDLRPGQQLVTDWILLNSRGDFRFSNTARETKVAHFEFGWGALLEDFSLDGRQDLVVAENYIAFPAHQLFRLPCRFLVQRPDGTFAAVEEQAGVVNESFAIAPITADFNADGYPDLVYTNLGGRPKAFLSRGGGQHSIQVRFPERAHFAGARAELTTLSGEILTDLYVVGEGLGSDSAPLLTFGLGPAGAAAKLEVTYLDGTVESFENPVAGQIQVTGQADPAAP